MFPDLINMDNVQEFLDKFDNILTDCDGVLWCGDDVIPGAEIALNKLRSLGKRIFFITNNSTKSRDTLVNKAIKLGFEAHKEEAISTSYAFAQHLNQIGFTGKVYIIGTDGIGEELDSVGIPHVGIGPIDVPSNVFDLTRTIQLDEEVTAVVIGFDPYFNMTKLVTAASYLSDPSCLFFVTTRDHRFPAGSSNIVLAGTGALCTCVETGTGRVAENIGKPHPRMFKVLAEKFNLNPQRTLIIGDNCATDILLGKNCGLKTLSVLTGISSFEDLTKFSHSSDPNIQRKLADYYIHSMGNFNDLLINK